MNHKKLIYTLDRATGWYKLTSAPPTASKLPNELKVEERQSDHIKASMIIHGRDRLPKEQDLKRGWRWFTGLRETNRSNIYTGSFRTFGRFRGSFVENFSLFRFSDNSEILTLWFFDGLTRRYGGIDDLMYLL
ncbi:hypothetical protein [Runella zeae]|uniref:hypothetical protein n=1 Tax=Runella zeae TaxID=94255 RepID=UPI0004070BCF|nr:hypothetical protein [Runella zeae]